MRRNVFSELLLASFSLVCVAPIAFSVQRTCNKVILSAAGTMEVIPWERVQAQVVAKGCFEDGIQQGSTGWGKLVINTTRTNSMDDQAWAAGLLEGYLTSLRIKQRYQSWSHATFGNQTREYHDATERYVQRQLLWVRAQVEKHGGADEYWAHVGATLAMMDGLSEGVRVAGGQKKYFNGNISRAIMMMNWDYDLFEIEGHLFPNGTGKKVDVQRRKQGHCRALVKLAADMSELFLGHTTWESYAMMLPVFKWYNMPLGKGTKSVSMSMSTYPGSLMSQQDFCMMSSGLVVISTTLPVLDNNVLAGLSPQTVPGWIRFVVANRMASSGPDYRTIIGKENSGSYTNQFMVVDLNKFHGKERRLDSNTLTVIEQLPTKMVSTDATPYLLQGYWPSYNRPFFPEVSIALGYPAAVSKYGEFWDYQRYCGAAIFRRDAAGIQSLDQFEKFLRYNDYQHDSLCALCAVDGKPVGACGIASRDDLNPGSSKMPGTTPVALWKLMAGGAIDAKVTTSGLARALHAKAQAGPTHDAQAPFEWSKSSFDRSMVHEGQVDRFQFGWETMVPPLFPANKEKKGRHVVKSVKKEETFAKMSAFKRLTQNRYDKR
jgi:hypothetical protein